MNSSYEVFIITLQGILFHADVSSTYVTTCSGEIGILPNHAPLITLVSKGWAKVKHEDKDIWFYVSDGLLHVTSDHKVKIIVEDSCFAKDLSEIDIRQELARENISDYEKQVCKTKLHLIEKLRS